MTRVGIVYRDLAGKEVVSKFRQWQSSKDWVTNQLIHERIESFRCLQAAANWHAEDRHNRLLITVGYRSQDLDQPLQTGPAAPSADCTLLVADETGGDRNRRRIACGNQPIRNLRETLVRRHLRGQGETRPLRSEKELIDYFRLRYRVWRASGFIPPDRDSAKSRLEIDYSDRTAIPIGYFTKDGRLVGCARLLGMFGRVKQRYLKLIRQIIEREGDKIVERNFEKPVFGISQPFDILEYFRDFRSYYRSIVVSARDNKRTARIGELSRVIVDKPHRGNHIGELLVYDIIALARDQGVSKLLLACRKELVPMYGNCGFRLIENIRSESFGAIPVPSFVMEQDIES